MRYLLFLFLFVSCASKVYHKQDTDPRIKPFLDNFIKRHQDSTELNRDRGVRIYFDKNWVNSFGYCILHKKVRERDLVINERYWNELDRDQKYWMLDSMLTDCVYEKYSYGHRILDITDIQ